MSKVDIDVVVPTVGRPSLATLLEVLAEQVGGAGPAVCVVDDRRPPTTALPIPPAATRLGSRLRILAGAAAGPAAARNIGWRAAAAGWVAFLDDDVVPEEGWWARLADDLGPLAADVAGSQGIVRVPRPAGRRPTDWERNVAGLETARWATADMAYRRAVLAEVGGFDERFRRAYREDADLALRVMNAGYRLTSGRRGVLHPVRPAGPWTSVRLQVGNRDDALMRRFHGPGWRELAEVPTGRRTRHLILTGAGLVGLAAIGARRRRLGTAAIGGWLVGVADLAWARIAPGPRSAREVATMVASSLAIPPAASWWWLRGLAEARRLPAWPASGPRQSAPSPSTGCRAVLFDRDGTLVQDVPYNGDPELVVAMAGARRALDRLRAAGVSTAVVSNQSGIGRGLLTSEQVAAVNRRVEELLGPVGPWLICPHDADDGCGCRKPAPGLVLRAAQLLGVEPAACVMVGDVGADTEAARAAGAGAVLVPTVRTRREEIAAAPVLAPDLGAAIDLILGGVVGGRR